MCQDPDLNRDRNLADAVARRREVSSALGRVRTSPWGCRAWAAWYLQPGSLVTSRRGAGTGRDQWRGSRVSEPDELVARVRGKIVARHLPKQDCRRTWHGYGTGVLCA